MLWTLHLRLLSDKVLKKKKRWYSLRGSTGSFIYLYSGFTEVCISACLSLLRIQWNPLELNWLGLSDTFWERKKLMKKEYSRGIIISRIKTNLFWTDWLLKGQCRTECKFCKVCFKNHSIWPFACSAVLSEHWQTTLLSQEASLSWAECHLK